MLVSYIVHLLLSLKQIFSYFFSNDVKTT